MNPDRQYFIVTSHGWSASYWLAHAMNLHPDITCSHSAENLLAEGPDLHNLDRQIEMHRNLHKGMIARQTRPLDATYDEIEKMGDTPIYGSVHTYRLRDLAVLGQKYGKPQRSFRVANLVRHPVSFVWSGFSHLKEMFSYDIYVLRGTLNLIMQAEDLLFDLRDKHKINLTDLDVIAFFGACGNLMNLAQDVRVGRDVQHVRMENVTTEPELFAKVATFLTAGRVLPDPGWIDGVFEVGEINTHKKGKKLSPNERFAAWEPWQREAFLGFLKLSDIGPAYESLGYELPKAA